MPEVPGLARELEAAYGRTRHLAVNIALPPQLALLVEAHRRITTVPPLPATPAHALAMLGVPPLSGACWDRLRRAGYEGEGCAGVFTDLASLPQPQQDVVIRGTALHLAQEHARLLVECGGPGDADSPTHFDRFVGVYAMGEAALGSNVPAGLAGGWAGQQALAATLATTPLTLLIVACTRPGVYRLQLEAQVQLAWDLRKIERAGLVARAVRYAAWRDRLMRPSPADFFERLPAEASGAFARPPAGASGVYFVRSCEHAVNRSKGWEGGACEQRREGGNAAVDARHSKQKVGCGILPERALAFATSEPAYLYLQPAQLPLAFYSDTPHYLLLHAVGRAALLAAEAEKTLCQGVASLPGVVMCVDGVVLAKGPILACLYFFNATHPLCTFCTLLPGLASHILAGCPACIGSAARAATLALLRSPPGVATCAHTLRSAPLSALCLAAPFHRIPTVTWISTLTRTVASTRLSAGGVAAGAVSTTQVTLRLTCAPTRASAFSARTVAAGLLRREPSISRCTCGTCTAFAGACFPAL